MSGIRNWLVETNASRPAGRIAGATLADAIREGSEILCAAALPAGGQWRPVGLSADWQETLFAFRGGIAVVVDAVSADGELEQFPVWVKAPRADLPRSVRLDLADV